MHACMYVRACIHVCMYVRAYCFLSLVRLCSAAFVCCLCCRLRLLDARLSTLDARRYTLTSSVQSRNSSSEETVHGRKPVTLLICIYIYKITHTLTTAKKYKNIKLFLFRLYGFKIKIVIYIYIYIFWKQRNSNKIHRTCASLAVFALVLSSRCKLYFSVWTSLGAREKKSIVRERQQNATTTTKRNTIGTNIYTFVLVSLFVITIIRHGETWVFQQKEKNCQGKQSNCIVHKVVHFYWVVLVITPKITKTWHHKAKAVSLLSHIHGIIYVYVLL